MLGAIAIVAALGAAALVYFTLIRDAGGNDCEAVATLPVTELPVTAERYDEAIAGLEEVQRLTREATTADPERRSELLDEAFEVFYASSDNVMHDADFQLCEADYDFAERIREDMLALEVAIGNQNNPDRIIELAEVLEVRLSEAKEVLFS
jgi:hypothetical protein